MTVPVNFFLIQTVLLVIVISVHTYLGIHVIRRGIVFSDLSLDQLAAFGVIIGLILGIPGGTMMSYIVSFIAVLCGSVLLAFIKPKNKLIPHEAVIGIIYGLALVGSILVADRFTGGMAYVNQTLCGTMLWINWDLVLITAAVYVALALFHYRFRHKFFAITEKPGSLKHENVWDLLFFVSLGVITVLIVPVAGVLLAYAFLMIPAAIATLFTRKWGKALIIGWSTGLAASIIGLVSSFYLNLPYGPTLVLSLGVFFIAAIIIKMIRPAPTM